MGSPVIRSSVIGSSVIRSPASEVSSVSSIESSLTDCELLFKDMISSSALTEIGYRTRSEINDNIIPKEVMRFFIHFPPSCFYPVQPLSFIIKLVIVKCNYPDLSDNIIPKAITLM